VAFDDVFTGADVAGVLAGSASGRLLLVTTDWSDSFALIDFLASLPGGSQLLADRLRLVIQQRMARSAPNTASAHLEPTRAHPVFDVLLASDALRGALRAGTPVAELRRMAAAEGHRELGEQLRALVAAGQITPKEAARLQS
jgi:hypothetical protein